MYRQALASVDARRMPRRAGAGDDARGDRLPDPRPPAPSPASRRGRRDDGDRADGGRVRDFAFAMGADPLAQDELTNGRALRRGARRSEEHTSELQSLMRISYAVFCLKKKTVQSNERTQTDNATYIINNMYNTIR